MNNTQINYNDAWILTEYPEVWKFECISKQYSFEGLSNFYNRLQRCEFPTFQLALSWACSTEGYDIDGIDLVKPSLTIKGKIIPPSRIQIWISPKRKYYEKIHEMEKWIGAHFNKAMYDFYFKNQEAIDKWSFKKLVCFGLAVCQTFTAEERQNVLDQFALDSTGYEEAQGNWPKKPNV